MGGWCSNMAKGVAAWIFHATSSQTGIRRIQYLRVLYLFGI
jgi:hypothetical protein